MGNGSLLKRGLLSFVATLMIVFALPGLVPPPMAQGDAALLAQVRFNGTIFAFKPGVVLVNTVNGTAAVPLSGAQFLQGTTLLTPSQVLALAPGTDVTVSLFPVSGRIAGIQSSMLSLESETGTYRVPLSAIPGPILAGIQVSVRLATGRIVRAPLDAALNLQRLQGAVILSGSGAGTRMALAKGQEIRAHLPSEVDVRASEPLELIAPKPLPQLGPGGVLPRVP